MKPINEISENTKVSLGFLGGITVLVISVVVSVSMTNARMDEKMSHQEKITDETAARVEVIDRRTARMEGILEEMRRK